MELGTIDAISSNNQFLVVIHSPRLSFFFNDTASTEIYTRRPEAASMRFDHAQTTTARRAPITRVTEPAPGDLDVCVSSSTSGVKP
jgi:hypothetical protein